DPRRPAPDRLRSRNGRRGRGDGSDRAPGPGETCHSRSLRVTGKLETNRTTMNDIPETAARPEAGSAKKASEQSDDGPSSSSGPTAQAEAQTADRPSFLERLAGLFRQRNGSTLREEIADALAETASDVESF